MPKYLYQYCVCKDWLTHTWQASRNRQSITPLWCACSCKVLYVYIQVLLWKILYGNKCYQLSITPQNSVEILYCTCQQKKFIATVLTYMPTIQIKYCIAAQKRHRPTEHSIPAPPHISNNYSIIIFAKKFGFQACVQCTVQDTVMHEGRATCM